jgi:hypothetical protein
MLCSILQKNSVVSHSKIVLRVTAFPILPILSVIVLVFGLLMTAFIHPLFFLPLVLLLLLLVRPVRLIYDKVNHRIGFYHILFGYAVNEVVKINPDVCELRLLLQTETEQRPLFTLRRNVSLGHIPFFDIKIVDDTGVLFELNSFTDYTEARDFLYSTAKKLELPPNDIYIQKVRDSKAKRNNR